MVNPPPLLVMEETASYLDQDGLWKHVITDLFEPFVLFFAPALYEQLDWSRQPESLEQELRRAYPEQKGKRYTDKLMKVHLKNGSEQWILAHIEVQGYEDKNFTERMFQYFYRIFDRYNRKIFAIALFADADPTFKPATYQYNFHGTRLSYTYNTYKLLDQDEDQLLKSNNPFAYAVLAGIYMLKSKNSASQRYQFKRRLFERILRDKEQKAREYADSLLYFVDFLLEVPKEMTRELQSGIQPMMIGKEASSMDYTKYPDPPTLKPFLDEMREKGKALGKAEGMAEGKAEGRAEGKAEGKAEGMAEGKEEGRAEGEKRKTKEVAMAMLKKDFSTADIMDVTGLSEKELNLIKTQM